MKKFIFRLGSLLIIILTLFFVYIIFTTKLLLWDIEGWTIRLMILWMLFSINFVHSRLNKMKTKYDFNYIDTLYRLKKIKEKEKEI